MIDKVVVAFAGGVVSREQKSAFDVFAEEIVNAINRAKAEKVPQGLIVAILHGHDVTETILMMED